MVCNVLIENKMRYVFNLTLFPVKYVIKYVCFYYVGLPTAFIFNDSHPRAR